jgi:hypothetical protein
MFSHTKAKVDAESDEIVKIKFSQNRLRANFSINNSSKFQSGCFSATK